MEAQPEPIFLDLRTELPVDILDFIKQNNIEVVYWDLGGTLADIRATLRERIVQKINHLCKRNITLDKYDQAVKVVWKRRESPEAVKAIKAVKTDADERQYWKDFYAEVLSELGVGHNHSQLINWLAKVQANPISFEIFPYVEDILPKLQELNIQVGIISNAFPSAKKILKHTNLWPRFRHIILSYEYNSIKPESAIYQKAIKKAGVKKEQVLFIDDRKSFVAGAAQFGMKALIVISDTSNKSKCDRGQQAMDRSLQQSTVDHFEAGMTICEEDIKPVHSAKWGLFGSLVSKLIA